MGAAAVLGWVVGGGLVGVVLVGMGCENRQRAAEQRSILALLPAAPTPQQAAAWMVDPFDADKRFRGTVLISNAPFGGEEEYLRLYRAYLEDEDTAVRAAAALALGLHGTSEDVPAIARQLESRDRLLRLAAARALQRLHNPVAVPALLKRLDAETEPEAEIRAEAATALGQYAEDRVMQGLIAALSDPRLVVTSAARNSLTTLTGQELPDDGRAWVTWAESTTEPFAGRREFRFPAFSRDRYWYEWIPLWPQPPNEEPGLPTGMGESVGSAGEAAGPSGG